MDGQRVITEVSVSECHLCHSTNLKKFGLGRNKSGDHPEVGVPRPPPDGLGDHLLREDETEPEADYDSPSTLL